MSDNNLNVPTQVTPPRGKNSDPRRQRLLRHMRRTDDPMPGARPQGVQTARQGLNVDQLPPAPQLPNSPENIRRYTTAAASSQRLFDAAERTLATAPLQRPVAATKGAYDQASADVAAAVQRTDYVTALTRLPAKVAAAEAVLAAQAQARAAAAKIQQLATQVTAYDDMTPILAEVKRTYLPQGMAENIGKQKLAKDPQFQTYLDALQKLENAKRGVDPKKPVPANLVAAIQLACAGAVSAAQAYLAHHENDLTDQQKTSNDGKLRQQYCQEGIKTASQYALAVELDVAGKPTERAPWDRETEMRMLGAQAQFAYEQGNKALTSTKEEGGAGKSSSYWVRSKSLDEVGQEIGSGTKDAKGSRAYIFKPMDGEDAPDGVKDHQPGAGAAKEALAYSNAQLFATQTGIDLKVPPTTVVSMGQYALKGGDLAGPPLIGSVQQLAGGTTTDVNGLSPETFNKVKATEVQKMALLDLMSLSIDRHGGNIMVDTTDPDDPKLVPIDHGGTLPSRESFSTAKGRMGGVGIDAFAENALPVNVLLLMPSAFEPFDPEILAGLDKLDPDAIAADMKQQLATMDHAHPGLGSAGKVGDESINMARRAMMFTKKAASTLSPAEIQLALTRRGEELFDAATDTLFDTVADQIIADAVPKKAALQEMLALTPNQRYDVIMFLKNNGWASTINAAEAMVMSEPKAAMDLYKSGTVNNAALPTTPFDAPQPDRTQDVTQVQIDSIVAVFPEFKGDLTQQTKLRADYAGFRAFEAMGGTTNELNRVVARVGGRAPTTPVNALAVMQAWAALQTPAYQQELQTLPIAGNTACLANLKELMAKKAATIQHDATLANVANVANRLDPSATALAGARNRLAEAKSLLDGFFDPARAVQLTTEWQVLSANLTQGAAPNQTAADFAAEMGRDAQALVVKITAAGLADADQAIIPIANQFRGLQAPPGAAPDVRDNFANLTSVKFAVSGAGNLRFARATIRTLQAAQAQMLQIAVPIAPQNQTAPQQPPQNAPTGNQIPPLAVFQWDQNAASAVKKLAEQRKLIKGDTGMSDALKAVNKARNAADNPKPNASDNAKISLYKAAEEACITFSRFLNSKLRMLSKDKSWGGYCDSAADATVSELDRFKALREALE